MTSGQTSRSIGAIFGSSRSGTTWLGAIIDSHPELVYRFEPFHRLQKTQNRIKEIYKLTRSNDFSAEHIPSIYNCLLPAYPECEKPPFFYKNFSTRLPFGKSLLWPLARTTSLGAKLFRYLYSPKSEPLLVFKEIDYPDLVVTLLAETKIPIVYIVRHPCAVVSSIMRGQEKSMMPMPEARLSVLKRVMTKHEPKLAAIYAGKLDTLTTSEQEALYWLVESRRALRACQQSPNASIVIYEELTERPLEIAREVFEHLNLTMPPESVAFIEESTQKSLKSAMMRGDVNMNRYASVFRDPKVSRNQWKEEMSQEDRMRVMTIVKDSPEFYLGAEKGFWA